MHAFDYTAIDFLIAFHDFGVINRSQPWARQGCRYASLVGLGLEGSPLRSGQTLPCRVFMGLHGRFGGRKQSRWLRIADGFAVWASAINTRSAKPNSRSAWLQSPQLQRALTLLSLRGDPQTARCSWPMFDFAADATPIPWLRGECDLGSWAKPLFNKKPRSRSA